MQTNKPLVDKVKQTKKDKMPEPKTQKGKTISSKESKRTEPDGKNVDAKKKLENSSNSILRKQTSTTTTTVKPKNTVTTTTMVKPKTTATTTTTVKAKTTATTTTTVKPKTTATTATATSKNTNKTVKVTQVPKIKSQWDAKRSETQTKPKTIAKQPSVSKRAAAISLVKSVPIVPVASLKSMSQIHNVTVFSPPPIRKDLPMPSVDDDDAEVVTESEKNHVSRQRMRTYTLEKIVSNASAAPVEASEMSSNPNQLQRQIVEPPISFEVHFDDANHPKKVPVHIDESQDDDADEDNSGQYEDDFESYESDFEEYSSSSNGSSLSQATTTSERETLSREEHTPTDNDPTANSYEMKAMSLPMDTDSQSVVDDNNNKNVNSKIQLAANVPTQGIVQTASTLMYENETIVPHAKSLQNIDSRPPKMSRMQRRGMELLKKITLDTVTFILYDCQPIPYDVFMKIYGKNDTVQASVQTHNIRIDQETQMEATATTDMWTQCPPTYYKQQMMAANFREYKNGCSESMHRHTETNGSRLNDYVKRLQNYRPIGETTSTAIDYERLNCFLFANEITFAQLNWTTSIEGQLHKSTLSNAFGYFAIDLAMDDFDVVRILVTSGLPGFLFTVHREIGGHLFLIAMWNLTNANVPIRLLSTWSAVSCVEIHANALDLLFAGLEDGSVAVWNHIEINHRHPTLSTHSPIKRFAPIQTVTPFIEQEKSHNWIDIGQVVAIRSIYSGIDEELLDGYSAKQICSLHDAGMLILWSVLETSGKLSANEPVSKQRIDHRSDWSNVKLIQNKLIDLRPHIQSQRMLTKTTPRPTSSSMSSFDEIHSHFESGLFDDAALHELQHKMESTEKNLPKFRCIALERTHDGSVLIATNWNFVYFGRHTMHNGVFQKLYVVNSSHIDALLPFNHCDNDVFLIVLRDGTIKSFNYDRFDRKWDDTIVNDCDDEPSSSSPCSLPSMPMASTASSSAAAIAATTSMIGHEIGKSCTIQSILQNERKLYDDVHALNKLDVGECTNVTASADGTANESNAMTDSRFVHDQIIIDYQFDQCTRQRQHFTQLFKSKRLAIVQRGQLRLFDETATEQPHFDRKCIEIVSTFANNNVEYLIILNENNRIEVHVLKSTGR